MITVPSTATVGETIEVKVSGSSRVGQTITVTINDGMGNSDSVQVDINADGDGTANWTVKDWPLANFEDGHCDAVVCGIEQPTSDQ